MKLKIIAALTILACLAGCNKNTAGGRSMRHVCGYCYVTTVESINGHDYVVLRGGHGASIIHAESCHCKGSK